MAYLKPQSPLKDFNTGDYIYPLTTADQIIMSDGSRLNTNAISMELLWQNASPDSSIATGAQIAVPLSDYDMYAILFKYRIEQPHYIPLHITPRGLHCYANYAGTSGQVVARPCLYRDSYIELRDSYLDGVVNNDTLVPFRIYGIKGVS